MPESQGGYIGVLAERIKALQEDVHELREQRKDDHHRLRSVESAVTALLDAQKAARESEARQYRQFGSRIQAGMLAMSACIVVLTIVTLLSHH